MHAADSFSYKLTGNATYTALWEAHLRSYTITWNIDGVETPQTFAYGTSPVFDGTPEKAQDAQYTYTFAGWSPEIGTVTENQTYTALWEAHLRSYTVTWNIDGNQTTQTLAYGTLQVPTSLRSIPQRLG